MTGGGYSELYPLHYVQVPTGLKD